jgi:prepilin-type N-terminal cleavage/methylation domain-containing protein
MDKYKNKIRGFTLIETLVAITVLMIAIAGPLTVANKAYHTALGTRDQVIATNLAQETMEYINYWKNNRTVGIFEGWEKDQDIATVPHIFDICYKDEPNPSCDIAGTPQGFTRYHYFTNKSTNKITTKTNQAIAHVKIIWEGPRNEEYETSLKTVLTNYHR